MSAHDDEARRRWLRERISYWTIAALIVLSMASFLTAVLVRGAEL